MSRSSVSRRSASHRPLIAFLLLAAFGILFAGCTPPQLQEEIYSFTEEDVARYRDLAEGGTGSGAPYLESLTGGSGTIVTGTGGEQTAVLDISNAASLDAMRTTPVTEQKRFQVTNTFLNLRSSPSARGAFLQRLDRGAPVDLVEFVNAEWAKVRLLDGTEGYVAHRYIGRVVSEERLAEEQKMYENQYVVNYGFVNFRSEPRQQSAKIGEIPGQTLLRPASVENGWAAVTHDGKSGFVSTSYLTAIRPNFLVRQDTFALPVLQYRLEGPPEEALQAMGAHVGALKRAGYTFITLRQFHALLLEQQSRDVRLPDNRIVVAVTGVTPVNVRALSDTLNALGINATLFIQSKHLGLTGITERMVQTLQANGFDLQSGTHTGDDLRALTNAQAELELKQSRALLEQATGRTVFAVSYPAGGTNDRIATLSANAGYLLGVTDGGKRTFTRAEFLHIPAFSIFPTMTADEVVALAKGG
jgi:peptidoglycan/xylan/chitin deacetylase (PgdA/CDA1 family)/SH3-like domain-containing protein